MVFRELRNGEKTIVTFPVTDMTDTIMVKIFIANEHLPELKENPVSYTHLDVYKRQVSGRRRGRCCGRGNPGRRIWSCFPGSASSFFRDGGALVRSDLHGLSLIHISSV